MGPLVDNSRWPSRKEKQAIDWDRSQVCVLPLLGENLLLKTIADEKVYTVGVDTAENRLYITIRGIWRDSDAKSYAEHVKQLVSQAPPGFTILMDMTKSAPQMPWIQDVSVELQRIAQKAGLKKNSRSL